MNISKNDDPELFEKMLYTRFDRKPISEYSRTRSFNICCFVNSSEFETKQITSASSIYILYDSPKYDADYSRLIYIVGGSQGVFYHHVIDRLISVGIPYEMSHFYSVEKPSKKSAYYETSKIINEVQSICHAQPVELYEIISDANFTNSHM